MTKRAEVADILTEMLGVSYNDADHAAGAVLAAIFANAKEDTQIGVETTVGNKKHVDMSFNGGFRTKADVFDAAKNGYRQYVQTRPVERKVTTLYGPWTTMEEED